MKIPAADKIPVWNQLPAWMRSKYFLVLTAYFTYMIFFDSNDFVSQWKLKRQLMQLDKQEAYYEQQLKSVKDERELLFSDPRSMEKFAREHYLMKKADETIFVIEESDASSERVAD